LSFKITYEELKYGSNIFINISIAGFKITYEELKWTQKAKGKLSKEEF